MNASGAAVGPTKGRVTYYTEEDRAAALANIEQFDWAKSEKESAVEKADAYLEQFTLEDLWNYIGSQKIPRSSWLAGGNAGYYPHSSGEWNASGLLADATYACNPGMKWEFSNGEYTLPTNDFEHYRQSGLDDRGCFDPERADDSLLVNEKHPEMGEKWGVDDGTGWVDENGDLGPKGQCWVPVAWAHHWNIAYGYRELLGSLYYAYLYTEEGRYARAASVILDRIGDVYPEFSLQDTVYFDDGGYTAVNGFPNNSHGGTGRGKQVGSIWEAYWIKSVLRGYDAVWPAQTGDTKLQEFLQAKATKYPGLAPKDSIADIRANIESGLIKEVLPATKKAQLRGNFGSHQTTLAIAAVVQDEPDGYTADTLDFLFEAGGLKNEDDGTEFGRQYLTGGDVLPSLLRTFDRDGHAYEGTVHYNSLVASAIQSVGDVLSGYDGYDGVDLYENVIFKQMFETQAPLTYLDSYVPHYGDTEGAGSPGFGEMIGVDDLVSAYERYDGPTQLAQWIHRLDGQPTEEDEGPTDQLREDIFDPEPNSVKREIQRVIDREGPLDLDSTQLAGFGFTALRAGEAGKNGRGVWTYYGRNAHGPDEGYGTSHTHHDTLNIGVFGKGLNLTPDLGYPEETGNWPKRENWTDNTISHNTVSVNERPQDKQWVAEPKGFDHTERVQLFDVAAPNVYEETSQYRRTTAQITIDEDSSYVVDFFRVTGGEDHHYSFHGTTAQAVETIGLDLAPQETGTYAGPNVEKPDHGEETTYNEEVGNGFNYLFDVERDDDPDGLFGMDWNVTDYWNARDDNADGVHLRLTMLGDADEVALADGKPPQRWDNPEKFTYLLAHRTGSNLESVFTSVIEPYEGDRVITSMSEVPVVSTDGSARAVKVELENGRRDYIVSATDPETDHVVEDSIVVRGTFAVYSEQDGRPEHAYLHNGEHLIADGELLVHRSQGRIEGRVESFTKELSMQNELTVRLTGSGSEEIENAVGNWIHLTDTAEKRNGAYEIEGVQTRQDNRATLDLGERTTVKEYKDGSNPSAGYTYILREGSPFSIPLSSSWSA